MVGALPHCGVAADNAPLKARYGLNNPTIPIISNNFGSKNKRRGPRTIRYELIYISVITLIGIALLQLFVRQIADIFSVAEQAHRLCVLTLRITLIPSKQENGISIVRDRCG